jgi:hypothetical protein
MGIRTFALVAAIAAATTGCIATKAPIGTNSVTVSPTVGGCSIFPTSSPWNTPVDKLAVRSDSRTMVAKISSTGGRSFLHADFGTNPTYGIPYKVVPSTQHRYPIHYTAYGDESNRGPFPIPPNAPIEGGSSSDGDRHVLVVQQGSPCKLYELGRAFWRGDHWDADVGVYWNLSIVGLRPLYWTSAGAAGLPILPGLVRYDEVARGHIDHAVRFTVAKTQRGFIFPATHYASSSTNPALPPMGLRLRLKASYSLSRFHGQSLVILKALKKYGMIVADNGSSWFITGAPNSHWNDTDLDQLKTVPGSAFEAVNTGPIHH